MGRGLKKETSYKKSWDEGLFGKVVELIPVLLHFCYYFVYRVAKEHNTVKQEDGPENIDLEGFETGADDSHEEYEGDPFPDLHLGHGPDKGFFWVRDHLIENEDLFVFGEVFLGVFFDEVFRGEVADD